MSLISYKTETIKELEDSYAAEKSQELSFDSGEEAADLSFCKESQ